jgi:hypothetical protein
MHAQPAPHSTLANNVTPHSTISLTIQLNFVDSATISKVALFVKPTLHVKLAIKHWDIF